MTSDWAFTFSMRSLGAGKQLALPRFDKGMDDRRPVADWPIVAGPLDLVIFEGWCVCSEAAPEADLDEPVNALEASQDADGAWRRYVNGRLTKTYPALFSRIDALVFLAAPGFEAIRRWRLDQETKLIEAQGDGASRVMSEAGVLRFIEHFERITRRDLEFMPSRADVVLQLDDGHNVSSASYRDAASRR